METQLDAFVTETRSDETDERVYMRPTVAFRRSECFISAAPECALSAAFGTQFERGRNAFGTIRDTKWKARQVVNPKVGFICFHLIVFRGHSHTVSIKTCFKRFLGGEHPIAHGTFP